MQYTPYTLPTLASGLVASGVAFTVWRRYREVTAAREFTIVAAVVALLCFAYAGELASATLTAKLWWLDLRYIGIVSLPPLALVLSFRFAGHDRWIHPRALALVAIIPLVTLAFAWTNEWHHWVGGPSQLVQREGYVLRTAESRPVFLVFALFGYGCMLATAFVYARSALRSRGHRRQAILLFILTLLPWFANAIYLFLGDTIDKGYDLSHIGFAIASLGWLYAIRMGRLFDVVPVARDRVFESLSDAVLVIDESLRVIDHNPAAQHTLGRTVAFIGNPLSDLFGEETAALLVSQSSIALLGRIYEVQQSVVRPRRGRPATVIMLRDITDRKREEAAREEAQRLAHEASQAQAQFIARMSHEVRSPLHGIVGAADLLLTTCALDTKGARYAGAVASSSRVLLALVDELLDFSSLDADRLHTEIVDLEARQLLDDAASMFSAAAERKSLAVTVQAPDSVAVRADRVRLQQVLGNLIGNAVKFTDTGSITLSARREGHMQRFEVRDTGVGIPAFAQAKIFEPFVQLQAAPREGPAGTGLGLSIARRMVLLMGGQMGVESDPGRGSTFWFTLPALDHAAFEAPRDAPIATRREGHVLVVDDEEVSRLITQGLLEREGCAVTAVASAAAALALLNTRAFDLIVTDVRMPDMNGYEFAMAVRQFSESSTRIPVVALSADVHTSAREEALRAGMDDWLAKPVDPTLLRRVLARWLAQASSAPAAVTRTLREYFAVDPAIYARIVAAFERTAPTDVEAITVATRQGDLKAARERAHSLQGAATVLGVPGLVQICAEVQQAAAADEALLMRLAQQARLALDALRVDETHP